MPPSHATRASRKLLCATRRHVVYNRSTTTPRHFCLACGFPPALAFRASALLSVIFTLRRAWRVPKRGLKLGSRDGRRESKRGATFGPQMKSLSAVRYGAI
eukprot:scaffold32664_cov84-Isochrysis_galbana.AAC.2